MLYMALGMVGSFVGGAVMAHFYGKNFLEELKREVDDGLDIIDHFKEIIDILVYDEEPEEEDEAE